MASVFLIHTPPSLIVIMGESRGFEISIHIVNEPSGGHIRSSFLILGCCDEAERWKRRKKPGTFFFSTQRTSRNQEPTLQQTATGEGVTLCSTHLYLSKQWRYLWSNQQAPLHNNQETTLMVIPVELVEVLSTRSLVPPPRGGCDTFVLGPQNRILLQHVFFI